MKIPDIAEIPHWKASRAAERFSPKEKAQVVRLTPARIEVKREEREARGSKTE